MFFKHRTLPIYLSMLTSLYVLPSYADNNYLFPSDIIDQSEMHQYDIGQSNRYANQRQWVYPQGSTKKSTKRYSTRYINWPLLNDESRVAN